MKLFKKYYLLILGIIALSGIVIYQTYAMFTETVETGDIVQMDTNVNYEFGLNGNEEFTVSSKSKLRFNAVIKNNMKGTMSYGLYYKSVSPSTLPSGVVIAQITDSLTLTTKGTINQDSTITIPVVINNPSDTDLTVKIGVAWGYATESQGPDDITYADGEQRITSMMTEAEVGSIFCNSTMECTSECESKQVNGEWIKYCYCTSGEKGEAPPRTSSEMLQYLGLTAKNGVPDFNTVATTDEGIYSAPDDYGTSYYFRGAVTNNYVKYADKYWRIIRINGDGSIRMIYDGTSAHANGISTTDRQIGTSAFNSTVNDNAYVGYMYGTTGSSSYAATHANTNNSTIKTTIDTWYKTNIQDKGYSSKLADVIYCNDRSVQTTDSSYTGNGSGTTTTAYKARERNYTNKSPSLICNQKNDAFTVNDTSKGNGALTYPIGLITADEAAMAGGKNATSNSSYYLYTVKLYWTMSPYDFDVSRAYEWVVYPNGNVRGDYVTGVSGVRPVLSIQSNVTFSGTGTQSDPWIVQP